MTLQYIQKDRVMEGGRRKSINLAIVSANNHYAGFGPRTANIFSKMVGLPEVVWSNGEEKNKKDEDDKSHLHGNSIHMIQILYDT
jgi:hypothetical protein